MSLTSSWRVWQRRVDLRSLQTIIQCERRLQESWRKQQRDYGNNNKQSLADYDDLDLENHLHVGQVLSGKKPSEVAVKTHQQTLSSLSSPPVSDSFPWYFKTVMVQQHLPHSLSCSPAMMIISQSSTSHHNRKRPCIIYILWFWFWLNSHIICNIVLLAKLLLCHRCIIRWVVLNMAGKWEW